MIRVGSSNILERKMPLGEPCFFFNSILSLFAEAKATSIPEKKAIIKMAMMMATITMVFIKDYEFNKIYVGITSPDLLYNRRDIRIGFKEGNNQLFRFLSCLVKICI